MRRGLEGHNRIRGYLTLLALAATTGCAGLPLAQSSTPEPMRTNCVCARYFAQSPRPAWVEAGDVVTSQTYQTSGSSQCTGLQSLDVDKADLSARSRLGRIVNTQVSSDISETRTAFGNGVGNGVGSAKASIQSSLLSKSLLENSQITHRWVDTAACRIYARVQIGAAQMKASQDKITKAKAARLIHQTFYVNTQDIAPAYRDLVAASAGQLLSKIGVTKITPTPQASSYQIKFTFAVTQLDAASALRGELRTQIAPPNGAIMWQQVTPAKGVSFRPSSNRALASKAITAAMRNLEPVLQARLLK
ncbi:MAG: hypothetical protein HOK33_05000 [Rhodobiaceae bacterium]|jgi:hypothetical protein|nr:hypothetical protein [Rhodobiaceae bacterium]MBT5518280.1 hypothetical protein [Rhodobiaceae bacterium]MBT7279383.1 hypothetical protein [Rhodobiaceae bacterium]MDG2496420.1 hypothetical protein [Alphaproteobacteria bacterium]